MDRVLALGLLALTVAAAPLHSTATVGSALPLTAAGGVCVSAPIAQDGNDSQVNPAASSTVTFAGLATTAGDAQVVLVSTNAGSATFTPPANFTQVDAATGFSRTAATYVATSSLSASPAFTTSAGTIAGIAVAYRNSSGVVDAHALSVAGNSNVSSASAVTPTAPGDVLAFLAMNDATTKNVTTAPSGLTEAAPTGGTTGSAWSERDYFLVNPPLAAQQPTLTWNYVATGNIAVGAYVVLKSSAACATNSGTVVLTNGVEWPATFRPYGPTSPWNIAMSNTTSPTLYANSDTIIGNMVNTGGGVGPAVHTAEHGGGAGYGHPVYLATASDPSPTPTCRIFCSPPGIPSAVYVAPKSRPVDGTDHHMVEVQPSGVEVGMWEVAQNGASNGVVAHDWIGSDVLDYGNGGSCTNFYTGSGFDSSGHGLTDVGSCGAGGTIRQAELAAGAINHRLFVSIQCVQQGTFVFPGFQNGDHWCTASGSNAHVPMGALLWSDLSDATVNALSIPADGKTLLRNLHNYGWFVGDTQCSGNPCPQANANFNFGMFVEPDVQFAAFGVTPPIVSYAIAQGWSSVVIGGSATRYILCDPCTWIDWRAHLHIVDPCYAQGTC